MPHVRWTPKARGDLDEIRTYIRDELQNPDAAQSTLVKIRQAAQALEYFPERGRPLSAVIPYKVPFRYLVVENYNIFYKVHPESVSIIRVLNCRQHMMRILFE